MNKKNLYKEERSKIYCLACHHYCLISEGKVGICGVRKNSKGKLELLVYGKVIAKHLDPIEKKPLFHFLPGTKVYSIGTVGCNYHCDFCQNWSISKEKKILGEELSPEQVKKEAKSCPNIAYTYNEPTIFIEYARDIALVNKDKKHIFVSNGYFSDEAFLEMKNFVSAINIDLKSFSEEFYKKKCGAKLQPVLNNIKNCWEAGIWTEVTTLLIPEENDSSEELKKIASFLAGISKDIPWHISAFHPDYRMLDKNSTSKVDLLRAYNIGKEAGLNYVYLGNVLDEKYSNTYCPKCERILIMRKGFEVEIKGLVSGKCKYCVEEIKGVWR